MGRQKKKTVVQEEVDESVSETEIETQQSDHGLEHKASAASLKGKVKKGGSSSSKGTPVKKIDFKRPDPPTRLKRPDMTPLKRPDMTPAGSKDSITVRPSTSISSASELLKRAPSSSPSSSAKKPASVRSTKSSSKRQVPPSESEQDDAGSIADSFFSSQRIRRTEDERLEYFKNQPECDQNRIDPHSVVCLKCNRTVKLGTRTTYTVKPWEAHRSKCDTPKDPSEPQTIRRTVEERKALLETDTRAAQIKPDEVLCARCNKWIQLLKTQDYSLSNWNKHQSTCSEAVPSDRVSSAERKLKILNDPQQKDYGPRHVSCKICDVEVMLEGPGDYELESWELHKSTCHPPSDTPAEEPVPAADVSVTSTEETAVDPPGSVAATLSAPRGLKRARSEEEEAIAVDDDNHQEESRPSNRQRDDSYEPTEGVGLFGLLKIPWKAFLDGWNLRKNKAISESLN